MKIKYLHGTASGNAIYLTDSSNMPVEKLKINGGYGQDTSDISTSNPSEIKTVGNNVNYFKVEPQTSYSVTVTVREDGGIVLNGTATQTVRITNVVDLGTGDFTLSVKSNKVDGGVYVRTRNKAGTLGLSTPLTSTSIITSNNTEAYSTELTINKDTVLEDFILYPKLERGLVATPYSPFGMGSVRIDVVNSNLLGFNAIQEGNVKVNEDGTITINGKGGFFLKIRKFIVKANTKYYLRWELISGTVSGVNIFMNPILKKGWINKDKFVESSVTEDSEISDIWINAGAVFSNAKIKIWISKSQNDFTKYQSQTAIMSIQQEMLEGDYIKDVEHHEWRKLILTGNDFNYLVQQNGKGLNYFIFRHPLVKIKGRIVSNMLKNNVDMWNTTQYIDCVSISSTQNIINIMLSDTTITTVAQFKAKLQELYNAGTPIVLYYELAEPLDLELTEEQKVAKSKINNISTYKNITNITIDDDLASVDVIYKKDLESEHNDFGKEISALITTVGNLLSEINDKVSKVAGKGLSQNDFTDEYKTKLDNLNETIPKIVDNLATEDSSKSLSAKQGKVLNEKIMGTVLYVNETETGGDITLSDNADNYDYFDFHCKRSTHIYTVRVYKPNNNTVSLTTSFCDGTYIYVYTKILNISGTQITVVRSNLGYFDNNGSHAGADDNNLIIKVVGYKII